METMKKEIILIALFAAAILSFHGCGTNAPYRALVLTGQGEHNWNLSSGNLKTILEQTALFDVKILKALPKGSMKESFFPEFAKYNLIVLDYNGDDWPADAKKSLVDYVNAGGALVIDQEAGAAFPAWKEYIDMCGFHADRKNVSKPHEFEIRTQNWENPVVKDFPARWLHTQDVQQFGLTGPAENTEVLASAFSDTLNGGSGRMEPVLMCVKYGKGRVFHTTLGSPEGDGSQAMKCAGFITSLQRGAEWAVTGNIAQTLPFDFPSAAISVTRPGFKSLTIEDDFAGLANYNIEKSTRYLTDLENRIRAARGRTEDIRKIESGMISLLRNKNATAEGKKLVLHELSWMGSDECLPAIKELATDPGLKDEAGFALERLGGK